jgi:adenine phosphoribosyltransferase
MDHLKTQIRHVPDFPKAGILFYDITTLLQEPAGFRAAIDSLALPFQHQGVEVVVGVESRGFIFGAVADRMAAASRRSENRASRRRPGATYALSAAWTP